MTDRTPRSLVRLIVGAIGFGLLMGSIPKEGSFWSSVLLASLAAAWLGSWLPFPAQASSSFRPAARWALFAVGVVGFALLMGLRENGSDASMRALIAGAAMGWLALFHSVGRRNATPAT